MNTARIAGPGILALEGNLPEDRHDLSASVFISAPSAWMRRSAIGIELVGIPERRRRRCSRRLLRACADLDSRRDGRPEPADGGGGSAVHHSTSLRLSRTAISIRSDRAGLTHMLDGKLALEPTDRLDCRRLIARLVQAVREPVERFVAPRLLRVGHRQPQLVDRARPLLVGDEVLRARQAASTPAPRLQLEGATSARTSRPSPARAPPAPRTRATCRRSACASSSPSEPPEPSNPEP